MLAAESASPLHKIYPYTEDNVLEPADVDTSKGGAGLYEQTKAPTENTTKLAPIQHLPFDILSYIFLLNSQMSDLAPITISEVCRSWRSSILSIPRAWSYIWLDQFRHKHNHQYVSIFLERSNPVPLHLYMPPARGYHRSYRMTEDVLGLVISNLYRLTCLHIPRGELERIVKDGLPNLSRLTLTRGDMYGPRHLEPSFINRAQFPQLRWLKSELGWNASTPSHLGFPPLQCLSLIISSSGIGVIIRSCAASLKALYLYSASTFTSQSQPVTIHLPVLQLLSWIAITKHPAWPIDATTPSLISFDNSGIGENVHTDVATVNNYRTQIIPDLSTLVSLRLLQLTGGSPYKIIQPESQLALASDLLELLHKNSDICSSLDTVEICMPPQELEADMISKQEEMILDLKTIRPHVTFRFTQTLSSISGSIEYTAVRRSPEFRTDLADSLLVQQQHAMLVR